MWRKIVSCCLLLALLTPVCLLIQVFADQPLTVERKTPDPTDALKTRALIRRTLRLFEARTAPTFAVSETELNAAISFLSRGDSRFSGQVRIDAQRFEGKFSYRLHLPPFGDYLNLSVTLLPSHTGLNIERVELGSLRVSGPLTQNIFRRGADLLLGDHLGTQVLAAIEAVALRPQRMNIRLVPGVQLTQLKKRLQDRLNNFRDSYADEQQRRNIRFYYQQLTALAQQTSHRENLSLTQFMAPLFQIAARRSPQSTPVEENQAAIFALAIFFGSQKLQQATGNILAPGESWPGAQLDHVTLGGRVDLRQHFLISAALKLMTDSEVGFMVGEFKELLDTNIGGSGFSFVDLAADRAGLAFAEQATSSSERASSFQRFMAEASDETVFSPDFSNLEEGLEEAAFSHRYGDVDSQTYQARVRLIDERIRYLPLFKL